MIWSLGGIVLWAGGWWFTGRLFGVYRKAVVMEEMDRRREGRDPAPPGHHTGALLFHTFDLGLLMLGVRCLSDLKARWAGLPPTDSLVVTAVEWSVLVCLYILRASSHLHHLYDDRWRVLTRHRGENVTPAPPGTWRGLWHATPSGIRALLLLAPLLAAVPVVSGLLGSHPNEVFYAPGGGHAGAFVLWFVAPQTLLAAAVAVPLLRARRLARGGLDD